MEIREQQIAHLERLAQELTSQGFVVEMAAAISKPHLKVANAGQPTLNERVQCQRAADSSWSYWWPWNQPIGPVDDLDGVADKIGLVLRSVEES